MDSQDYRRVDREYLWHPYTDYRELMSESFPVIEEGEGIYLYDVDRRRYVDAISSWWACNLGHGRSEIVEAIKGQVDQLQHSILGNQSHPRAVELARKLVELTGRGRRAHFASDGASAVEAALKIALQYWQNLGVTERDRFAYLAGDYHGDTLGAVSVGYLQDFHSPFESAVPTQEAAAAPDCVKCDESPDAERCSLDCYDAMEQLLAEESDRLAAVVVEPLCQAATGMNIYPSEFLKKLALQCREEDVLLIDDEIAMGLGRTGRMWAYEHAEIRPDIVCVGKGVTAGYLPLSAALVDDDIFSAFKSPPGSRTFFHGHTFAGNPVAAAAALATLKVYEENPVLEQVSELNDILTEKLKKLEELSAVRATRTLGLLGAVYLGGDSPARGRQLADRIKKELLRRNILVRPLGSVVYLMPPLVIDPDQLEDLCEEFTGTVGQLAGE